MLAWTPLRFLWADRDARAIALHVKHLVRRHRDHLGAGPRPLGHLRPQAVDHALNAPTGYFQAGVLVETLRGRLIMFHRSRPAHQPRQGGRATLHNPQRLVQGSAAAPLAVGIIVAARNDFSKQAAQLVGAARVAFFPGTRLILFYSPVGIVEQVFQGAPAILPQGVLNPQLQPLRRQAPLDGQARLGYGDEGFEFGGGFLADGRLEFFFVAVALCAWRVCWTVNSMHS